MIGHITYLSEEQMHAKFGRRLQNRDSFSYDFKTDFQVESYLKYQGDAFVKRFDANSYLYISKAMDYYDLAGGRSLVEALAGVQAEFLVVSFTSDWLFPTHQSKEIVPAPSRPTVCRPPFWKSPAATDTIRFCCPACPCTTPSVASWPTRRSGSAAKAKRVEHEQQPATDQATARL